MIIQLLQNYLLLHPFLSPVAYIFFHILFAILLIPCSPMSIIAGVIWGKWLGFSISVFSAFLSSSVTFGLSRIFFKKRVYRFLAKRYSKIDWFLEQTKKQGWKFVAAVQLNPVAPGSTLGYLFGLTAIDFSTYTYYLIIFMLPLQLLFVMMGNSISEIYTGKLFWIVWQLPLITLVVYIWYKISRKNIDNKIEG